MAENKPVERTLIAEYILAGQRYGAGRRMPFTATQYKAAVTAGVIHDDEKLDAEVPVNDPQGQIDDEDKGSPPARSARGQDRRRRNR
jgi:hypothetical protein